MATLLANQLFWQTTYVPTLFTFAAFVVYQFTLLFLPIAFFMAVQRYRLYDIDILINRALVYGSLTAILGGIYLVCVLGAQYVLSAVISPSTGNSPAVIVATTLLVATLIRPLRRRLQSGIDHRFYRRKYDAAKTLADFSRTLRQEVDLPTLVTELTDVVQTTMQPAHVSLWLSAPTEIAGAGVRDK